MVFLSSAFTTQGAIAATATWVALAAPGATQSAIMFGGVSSIAMLGSDLYVAGQFEEVGGDPAADNLVRWNGATWSTVGTSSLGPTHPVFDSPVAEVLAVGNVLYAAGNFENAAGIPEADHIAMWDGENWSALGSNGSGNGAINGAFPVQIEALAAVGDDLYVGGNFANAGGELTADMIARWDGDDWHGVGSDGAGNGAISGAVKDIMPADGGLYVGGAFQDAGGEPPADYIAFFDGQDWLPLGSNDAGEGMLESSVYTLARIGTNIYAGGRFVNIWGSGNYVSRWDGTDWRPVGGNTLNGDVFDLAVFNGHLIAGGNFNIPADYIAILDNGAWSTLGPEEALDYRVFALLVNGTDIYAGGQFSNAGGQPLADRIAVLRSGTGAHRPDARIRKGDGPTIGNNIYNDNGTNQAISGTKGVGKTITFTLSIQNDGDFKERFRVHSEGITTSMYLVRYFRGTNEITSAVVNGTYLTSALAPGKSLAIRVTVKVMASAAPHSSVSRLITITSQSDPAIDAVRLKASRK